VTAAITTPARSATRDGANALDRLTANRLFEDDSPEET
jgi:hypothetical protein